MARRNFPYTPLLCTRVTAAHSARSPSYRCRRTSFTFATRIASMREPRQDQLEYFCENTPAAQRAHERTWLPTPSCSVSNSSKSSASRSSQIIHIYLHKPVTEFRGSYVHPSRLKHTIVKSLRMLSQRLVSSGSLRPQRYRARRGEISQGRGWRKQSSRRPASA